MACVLSSPSVHVIKRRIDIERLTLVLLFSPHRSSRPTAVSSRLGTDEKLLVTANVDSSEVRGVKSAPPYRTDLLMHQRHAPGVAPAWVIVSRLVEIRISMEQWMHHVAAAGYWRDEANKTPWSKHQEMGYGQAPRYWAALRRGALHVVVAAAMQHYSSRVHAAVPFPDGDARG